MHGFLRTQPACNRPWRSRVSGHALSGHSQSVQPKGTRHLCVYNVPGHSFPNECPCLFHSKNSDFSSQNKVPFNSVVWSFFSLSLSKSYTQVNIDRYARVCLHTHQSLHASVNPPEPPPATQTLSAFQNDPRNSPLYIKFVCRHYRHLSALQEVRDSDKFPFCEVAHSWVLSKSHR